MPDHHLIERYVSGTCTLPEKVAMDRWIAANPEWEYAIKAINHDVAQARNARHAARGDMHTAAEVSEIDQLMSRISEAKANPVISTRGHRSRPPLSSKFKSWDRARRTLIASAAGAIALLIAFVSIIDIASDKTSTSSRLVFTYTTGNGHRSTITLSDGSKVILNVSSRLEVPVDYYAGNRALKLEGEAIFSVAPNAKSPFTVTSGSTTTRVLGTNFIVRHYPTDTATLVSVRDGRVSVEGTILNASQQAVVHPAREPVLTTFTPSRFNFVDGILTFENVLLVEAVQDLNRWYDVDIRIADPTLLTETVEGGFKAGSDSNLISILELMYNVRVVKEGKTLTLYRRVESL